MEVKEVDAALVLDTLHYNHQTSIHISRDQDGIHSLQWHSVSDNLNHWQLDYLMRQYILYDSGHLVIIFSDSGLAYYLDQLNEPVQTHLVRTQAEGWNAVVPEPAIVGL